MTIYVSGRQLLKVLLVDDISSIREMLRTLLGLERGFEIVGEAVNGQEATQMAEKLRPDLVVMDLHMPVMDGLEATSQITTRMPDIKIVAYTSSDAPSTGRHFEDAGAVAHLTKGETAGLMETLRGLRDAQGSA